MAIVFLLQYSTNVGVGGVSGEAEDGGGIWVGKASGLGKGGFSSLKGGGHRRSPVESTP